MSTFFRIFLLLLIPVLVKAQGDPFVEIWTDQQIDSMQSEWKKTDGNDTTRMRLARSLGWHYQEINRDSSFYFHTIVLDLARKLKLKLWEADALDAAGWVLAQLKNYPLSLQYFMEALDILQNRDCEKNIWHITLFSPDKDPEKARLTCLASTYNDLAVLYTSVGNTEKELSTFLLGLKTAKGINNQTMLTLITLNMAGTYLRSGKTDLALEYINISLDYMKRSGYITYRGEALITKGDIFLIKKDYSAAKQFFDLSVTANLENNIRTGRPNNALALARYYQSTGKKDSVIYYTREAILGFLDAKNYAAVTKAYASMYSLYKQAGRSDSAYFFLQLYTRLNDSLNLAEKGKIDAYQNMAFNQQLAIGQREKKQIQKENLIRTYGLLAGIVVFMVIAFLLYRNSQNRKKTNRLLQNRNDEVETQKKQLEKTLSELKATQAQLIQSEKMASLGELTAGIAHEIQNPLNFVNNFSEVNCELISELVDEVDKGNTAEVKLIAADIMENSEKIVHHGKRADAIVKGMLQHSRSSSNQKEPTDINALADEYLRLAYHGLRAKDKSFNATMHTDYDASIGSIQIVPQDIGRVILNLITNAFYVVNEKRSSFAKATEDPAFAKATEDKYEPAVSVSTRKLDGKVEIKVTDNGNGIPQKVLDKVFQPFFTTKPAGQGTGLGLSLSYDIVKAHGGEIKLETKEGEGTIFIIQLPDSLS